MDITDEAAQAQADYSAALRRRAEVKRELDALLNRLDACDAKCSILHARMVEAFLKIPS